MTDVNAALRRRSDSAEPAPRPPTWTPCGPTSAPVTVEEILGAWRGGDFSTGHVASTVLEKVRWHGKRFDSAAGRQAADLPGRGRRALLQPRRPAAAPRRRCGPSSSAARRPRPWSTTAMPVFDHFKQVDDRHADGDHERQARVGLRRRGPLLLLARSGRRMRTTVAIVNEQGGAFTLRGGRARRAPRRRGAGAHRRHRPLPHRHLAAGHPARRRCSRGVFGHEGAGVVEQVGADVTGIEVGDHVRAELPLLPRLRELHGGRGRLLRERR